MNRIKHLLSASFFSLSLSFYHTLTVFAVSEGELQAQVEAAGKETVSGNVLIWFLCAIAFLKVSQKIDSFISGPFF